IPTATPSSPGPRPIGTVVSFDNDGNSTAGWAPSADATPTVKTAAPTYHYTTTNNGIAPTDPDCTTATTGNSFTLLQNPTWIKVIACKANHKASAVADLGNYTVTGVAPPQPSVGPLVPQTGINTTFTLPE